MFEFNQSFLTVTMAISLILSLSGFGLLWCKDNRGYMLAKWGLSVGVSIPLVLLFPYSMGQTRLLGDLQLSHLFISLALTLMLFGLFFVAYISREYTLKKMHESENALNEAD